MWVSSANENAGFGKAGLLHSLSQLLFVLQIAFYVWEKQTPKGPVGGERQ